MCKAELATRASGELPIGLKAYKGRNVNPSDYIGSGFDVLESNKRDSMQYYGLLRGRDGQDRWTSLDSAVLLQPLERPASKKDV